MGYFVQKFFCLLPIKKKTKKLLFVLFTPRVVFKSLCPLVYSVLIYQKKKKNPGCSFYSRMRKMEFFEKSAMDEEMVTLQKKGLLRRLLGDIGVCQ